MDLAAKWNDRLRRAPKDHKAQSESDSERPVLPNKPLWSPSVEEEAASAATLKHPLGGADAITRTRKDSHYAREVAPPGRYKARLSGGSDISAHPELDMLKQPETRPISQEQLVAEVKGIYAGLVMVESKCIEVDNAQSSSQNDSSNKLDNEQWRALIALHRTLLHEHHDFFLASQHPSASPALRRLAAKYAMPARMWRHGIHSFLELLRHRLPASLDHMLSFIYMAYSMMALLYETVPEFEDTWIECLGDLARYRMAIEDDRIADREVWASVSRYWYSKASDIAPKKGRLYHHLAILARPNALAQLHHYAKSLCVSGPFASARQSIIALFDPLLPNTPHPNRECPGIATGDPSDPNIGVSNTSLGLTIPEHGEQNGCSSMVLLDAGQEHILPGCGTEATTTSSDDHPVALDSRAAGTPATTDLNWLKFNTTTSMVKRRVTTTGKLVRLGLAFAMFHIVIANPPVPHRLPKVVLLGASAMGSLSTGMAAQQLENPGHPGADPGQLVTMWLRIGSSALLGILAVGYPLWFLRYAHQKRAFLYGFSTCSFFLWLFVRPNLSAAADAFPLLHAVNLFGLIAVIVGILNAESSLFSSLFSQGRTDVDNDGTGDGDGDSDDEDGFSRRGPDGPNDEENLILAPLDHGNGTRALDAASHRRRGSRFAFLLNVLNVLGPYPQAASNAGVLGAMGSAM